MTQNETLAANRMDALTAAYHKLQAESDEQAEKREAELAAEASKPKTVDELFERFGKKTNQVRCGCIGTGHRGPRPTSGVTAVWLGKTYERCGNCGKTFRYNRVIEGA